MSSSALGGSINRKMLPWAVVMPLAIGWLTGRGEAAGYYDTQLGLVLFALCSMLMAVAIVYWSATLANRIEAERDACL